MKQKRFLFILAICLNALCGFAQSLTVNSQLGYGELFRHCVKSCDEFMCRFNEDELFPGLNLDMSDFSKRNFLFLFDYKLSDEKGKKTFLQEISNFYSAVKSNKIKLSYDSKKWYAELRVGFLFKRKEVELGVILQPEMTPLNLQSWSIIGINGLEKVGYKDSTKRYAISPEQHESLFVEMESDFKYYSGDFSFFRGRNVELDALSYFFALVESGSLIFQRRISTQFHFFDVPSYIFTIQYHARNKFNTGWLISKFLHVDEKEKLDYLNGLLGK